MRDFGVFGNGFFPEGLGLFSPWGVPIAEDDFAVQTGGLCGVACQAERFGGFKTGLAAEPSIRVIHKWQPEKGPGGLFVFLPLFPGLANHKVRATP